MSIVMGVGRVIVDLSIAPAVDNIWILEHGYWNRI